jgi:hypothetical protein
MHGAGQVQLLETLSLKMSAFPMLSGIYEMS